MGIAWYPGVMNKSYTVIGKLKKGYLKFGMIDRNIQSKNKISSD